MEKTNSAREGARISFTAECLLNAKQVRNKLGGCSEMHLWRLTHDTSYEALKFPKAIKINNRNYWRQSAIDRWIVSRERASATEVA